MIIATFSKKNGSYCGFRICGHSGYSEEGSDIVCAAVSSMAMLTVNTISDELGIPAEIMVEEDGPVIDFKLKTDDRYASALISGFAKEIAALESDFPDNVRLVED
jgi:uncharacterized protein YsxB (DUF464 family)